MAIMVDDVAPHGRPVDDVAPHGRPLDDVAPRGHPGGRRGAA